MKIADKQLAVEDNGSGDAVLMVHGLGGTSNTWYTQAAVLTRAFRVIRPDLEGSGCSALSGPLTISGFADDMIAILDACEVDKVHLVGHSMGTMICQHMAAAHPDRVLSLALFGPIIELPDPARKATRERAALVRKEGMRPVADALLQIAISGASRSANPAIGAFLRETVMRQDPEGYASTCEALAAADAADLCNVRCPTLVVTGDEDMVAPPAVARKLGKKLPDAKVRLLSGCAHWAPIERPQAVNDALLDHLLA